MLQFSGCEKRVRKKVSLFRLFYKSIINRWVFIILFIFLVFSGNATTYYVSNSGDDTNPGTSEELPWRTLIKVNYFFRLKPGDQVLFKRGDSWTGTLRVNASGTADSPIVYGAYGSGEKPKIYGSEEITGWTLHEGNIWKAEVKISDVHQLFLNDKQMQLARYPKSGYFTVTSKVKNTVFVSGDLDRSTDYTRATCFIKSTPWAMDAIEVSKSNFQTITLKSAPAYGVAVNYGFWLANKLEFLTQAGEWFYDSGTNMLYFWTQNGDSPDNYVARASAFSHGIYISEKNHIELQDIELVQFGRDGINVISSNNIRIRNCIVTDPGRYGIYEELNNNLVIDNNSIYGANSGVKVMYSEGTVITNNLIQNTGQINNFNKTIDNQDATAIFVRGNNHVIHYNRIINAGYIGINSTGLNVSIKYNYIDGACQVLDDGAGIYVSSSNFGTYPKNDFTVGTIIENNIVINVHGVTEGKPIDNTYPHGNGIYLDWSSKGVTVRNNTVNFVSQGIYIQGGGQHVVEGNTFMDAMLGYRFNAGNEDILFSENIIYQTARLGRHILTSSTVANQKLVYSNTGTYGKYKFENNTYVARYSQENLLRLTKPNGDAVFVNDFKEWKKLTGQDTHSKYISTPLTTGESEQILYNDTKQPLIFDLGTETFKDIYGKEVSGKLKLDPFTSVILIGKDFSGINKEPVILDQSFNFKSPVYYNDTIGKIADHDPDAGQQMRYSIISEEENGWLSVDSISGVIYSNKRFQTENDVTFHLHIKVTYNAVNSLSDTVLVVVNILGKEIVPPLISAFEIPDVVLGFSVPVHSFAATGEFEISGYKITESLSFPTDTSEWSSSPPGEYIVTTEGTYILYAWAKDTFGNVSNPVKDTVTVVIPDYSPTFSEYQFEEETGNDILDSQGVNDGTVVNEITRTNGAKGSGLGFTGLGYLNIGQCFDINVQNEISVSVWLKPDEDSLGDKGIVIHGGPNSVTFGLFLNSVLKTIDFITSGTTAPSLKVENAGRLWDGNWHHLVAVYNGEEKIICLDNVIIAKISATGTIDIGLGYNLMVGAGTDEPNPINLYKGLLDEVQIYNFGISANNVNQLFHKVNRELNLIFTTEDISICEGEDYLGWKEPGQYERVLQRVSPLYSGADSIVTTNLHINPVYITLEDVTIGKGENYKGLTETGTYGMNFESVTGCDSIVTTNLVVEERITQHIELEEGWNIFSSYLVPAEKDIGYLMSALRSQNSLIMVRDESDNTYEEGKSSGLWTNSIGDFQNTEGYKILVNSTSTLEITGTGIELPLEVELKRGANIIAFPFDHDIDAMHIFQPLIDQGILEKVQDESGNSIEYWNAIGWINGIGNLNAGNGYLVHVNNSGTLKINEVSEKSNAVFATKSELKYFKVGFKGNGYAHMNINITGLKESGLMVGDEIAVYDEEKCVGAIPLNDWHFRLNVVSIPASATDKLTDTGFKEGNPINFLVWRKHKSEIVKLTPEIVAGQLLFSKYSSVFMSFNYLPNLSENIRIFPNPVENVVFVEISILPEEGAEIYLLDAAGKELIRKIVYSNIEKIDVKNLPSGLYILKALVEDKVFTNKIIVA